MGGAVALGLWLQPEYYRGPCYARPLSLPRQDLHPQAVNLRRELSTQLPAPEWLPQQRAPYFKRAQDLMGFWQCDRASRREIAAAAYRSLLAFPRDPSLQVQAVQLLVWAEPEMRGLSDIQTQLWEQLIPQARALEEPTALIRLSLNLMKEALRHQEYEQVEAYFNALQAQVGERIPAGFQQLLHLELARAHWGQGQRPQALSQLQRALSFAGGGWDKRIRAQHSQWRRLISP